MNRRIKKTISESGTTTKKKYLYDGDNIALILDDENEIKNRFLHGPAIDQVIADEQFIDGVFDKVLWGLSDHQGSLRDLVDHSGTVQNHITYDSFGNIIETDASVQHHFGYTGRETDPESDLYYYRARYYDATVGRFISEDPLGFDAGDMNLSRYVSNSPLSNTDPTGIEELPAFEHGTSPYEIFREMIYVAMLMGYSIHV